MKRHIHNFDTVLTDRVQRVPTWFGPVYRAATTLGHPAVVMAITAGLFIWAQASDQTNLAIACLIVIITIVVGNVLKLVFRRVRPVNDYVEAMLIRTFSFPSGHAAGAMVGFGFFGYLIYQLLASPFGLIGAIACGLAVWLVGLSRVYLGAHYPSDVIAGWLVGLVGLLVIVLAVGPLV